MKPAPMAPEYDRLQVLERAGRARENRAAVYRVRCVCGTTFRVLGISLRNGDTRSCGCLQRERVALSNRRRGFRRRAAKWLRRAR